MFSSKLSTFSSDRSLRYHGEKLMLVSQLIQVFTVKSSWYIALIVSKYIKYVSHSFMISNAP